MKILFYFLIFPPIMLYANSIDTISAYSLSKQFIEELNYYNLIIKTGKKSFSNFYIGLDLNTILKVFNSNINSLKKIQFLSNDSLCWEVAELQNFNFIWFFQQKRYKYKDTLSFSESKQAKKIALDKVYAGYKYLNPIKIILRNPNEDLDSKNLALYTLVYSGNRFLFSLPNVTKIIFYR